MLLALALLPGLAGCGSGSGATPGPTPTPSPPTVSSLSPQSAPAGALAFTLTVNGSNFSSGSTVQWGGSSRTTTLVSSSQLRAQIMAADLAAAGKVAVTVVNPGPGGGSSNAATFTIAPDTITFYSNRAFDGSNATNANGIFNVWVMNPDGSGATALDGLIATSLTSPLGAASDVPAWSPDGSKIVFQSARALHLSDAVNANDTFNIWTVNPDGSGLSPLTKLTAAGAGSFEPAWSPDGSKIAFASRRAFDGSDNANTNTTANIWVMNADGSGATPLTKLQLTFGADSFEPSWSPDGSKIVFRSRRALDGTDNAIVPNNIWVIKADGTGATPLTNLTAVGADSFRPVWSPDGSKIVFESRRALDPTSNASNSNDTDNIWVMNADGSAATPLTNITAANADSARPAWSPDGSKIVFESQRALDLSDNANTNLTFNIWVVNADGSGATALTMGTALGSSSSDAVWSPGGNKIFLVSLKALDGSNAGILAFNIWVVNADGTGATPLTTLTAVGVNTAQPRQP
jgi:Tol biopolymer transport system component